MARHASYWEGALAPAPPASELAARTDVLIVGAGLMGCWLALFLQRLRPAPSILVVERDLVGYGASTRNAGFLTCGNISEMLEDSRLLGLDDVIEVFERRRRGIEIVRADLPGLALDECGSADFDPVTDEKCDFAARVNKAAGGAVFEEGRAMLGGREQAVIRNGSDAGLHPGELLAALRARCTGATFAHGVEIRALGEGRVHWAAGGQEGETSYGQAFVCTNGFAVELDAASKVLPGRGQIIVTSPVRARTERVLGYMRAGYDYFRFADGRLLIGGGRDCFRDAEATTRMEASAEVLKHLKAAAARVLGHNEFRVEWHWAGVMGFVGGAHLGGSPLRRMDESTEAVAGFGGMGVALTPLTAREIVSRMTA